MLVPGTMCGQNTQKKWVSVNDLRTIGLASVDKAPRCAKMKIRLASHYKKYYFMHGTSHSHWIKHPRLRALKNNLLWPIWSITVEPAIYIPARNKNGIRLEDECSIQRKGLPLTLWRSISYEWGDSRSWECQEVAWISMSRRDLANCFVLRTEYIIDKVPDGLCLGDSFFLASRFIYLMKGWVLVIYLNSANFNFWSGCDLRY